MATRLARIGYTIPTYGWVIAVGFSVLRRQRGVVHLVRLEMADVRHQQLNRDGHRLEAAHVLRLRQIALRAVREGVAAMRRST